MEPENKACKDGVAAVKQQMEERSNSMENSVANAFAAPDAMEKVGLSCYVLSPPFPLSFPISILAHTLILLYYHLIALETYPSFLFLFV